MSFYNSQGIPLQPFDNTAESISRSANFPNRQGYYQYQYQPHYQFQYQPGINPTNWQNWGNVNTGPSQSRPYASQSQPPKKPVQFPGPVNNKTYNYNLYPFDNRTNPIIINTPSVSNPSTQNR